MRTLSHITKSASFAGAFLAEVLLSEIDIPEGRAPRGLVHSIRNLGLIEPVVLTEPSPEFGNPLCHVIAGRRRLLALQELKKTSVIAIMHNDSLADNAQHTLSENLMRSRNLVSELQAYRDLRRNGKTDEDIQVELGLFKRDVKQLAMLASMAPITETMLTVGRIAPSSAKVLAKLSHSDQEQFFSHVKEDCKFTLASAKEWRMRCLFPHNQLTFLEDIPFA